MKMKGEAHVNICTSYVSIGGTESSAIKGNFKWTNGCGVDHWIVILSLPFEMEYGVYGGGGNENNAICTRSFFTSVRIDAISVPAATLAIFFLLYNRIGELRCSIISAKCSFSFRMAICSGVSPLSSCIYKYGSYFTEEKIA